jgi:carbon-monoxide dehydrogenase medium subunit
VKPPAFDYVRPSTVADTIALLAEHGDRARVLAGGQSLVLELNFRRIRPAILVDINAVAELDTLELASGALRVGALTRHARFAIEPAGDPLGRLLSRISHFVAHPPIRTRGTMVGSLAYAHPAAEWPAAAVALGAEVTLASTGGSRAVPAESFFDGAFSTVRRPDELIVDAAFPALPSQAGIGFEEYRRTEASFAVVAALAVLEIDGGAVRSARIGLAGAADRPLRAHGAEQVLTGEAAGGDSFTRAAAAAAQESRPVSEPHCSSEYRRHVVEVVVRRALEQAAGDAGR